MISEISLERFQGFEHLENAPLRRLNLIFGPNASGKSSITRALLLIKQSLPSNLQFLNAPSVVTYNGPDISLASFANVVFKHEEDSQMKIALTFDRVDLMLDGTARKRPALGAIKKIKVEFTLSKSTSFEGISITYHLLNRTAPVVLRFRRRGDSEFAAYTGELVDGEDSLNILLAEESAVNSPNTGTTSGNDKSVKNSWKVFFKAAEFRLRGNFPATYSRREDIEIRENAMEPMRQVIDSLLLIARVTSSRHFRNFKSIGPLRKIAERLEYNAGPAIDQDDKTPSIEELRKRNAKVSDWLLRLTGGRYRFEHLEFQVGLASFLGSLKSEIVIDTATDTPVTFSDVGVGLSQIVPILQSLYEPSPSRGRARPSAPEIVTVEQPELHLHPAMQADLAELFVDALQERRSLQIVAETHSEALLLRTQKLLRQGKIKKEDVQILFVDRATTSDYGDPRGNTISVLEIDEDDDFSISMPKSFTRLRLDELI